jgi:hypothetical protein
MLVVVDHMLLMRRVMAALKLSVVLQHCHLKVLSVMWGL